MVDSVSLIMTHWPGRLWKILTLGLFPTWWMLSSQGTETRTAEHTDGTVSGQQERLWPSQNLQACALRFVLGEGQIATVEIPNYQNIPNSLL